MELIVKQGRFMQATDVDAWACFIPRDLSWEGGLNQAILASAGEAFDNYILENVHQPKISQVFVTPAFNAPVSHIVLGVLPEWRDALFDEEQMVVRCYKNMMKCVQDHNIPSLAIPSLGGGKRGFPQKRIVRLTLNVIKSNYPDCLKQVQIICKDDASFGAYKERLS